MKSLSGKSLGLRSSLLLGSLAVTTLLAGLYLFQPRSLESLNLKATDIIVSLMQRPQSDLDVVTVAIDNESLETYGQWPWTRYRVAQLLEKITAGQPGSVGIDIIFAERDRTSPSLWQETLKREHGYTIDTSGIPEDILDYDSYLAKVLSRGPFVLGHSFCFTPDKKGGQPCFMQPVSIISAAPSSPARPGLFEARGAICNYDVLGRAVSRSGFLNGTADPDGILRRLPLLINYNGQTYPSLVLAMLMEMESSHQLILDTRITGVSRFSVGNYQILADNRSNFILSYDSTDNAAALSATDILEDRIPSEFFKDKAVLIGLTATGLSQEYRTPLSQSSPLLDVYRSALLTLTAKTIPVRPPGVPILETIFSLLAGLALSAAVAQLSTILTIIFCLLAVFLSWLGAGAIFLGSGYVFSPLLPTLTLSAGSCLLLMQKFYFFQQKARSETGDTLLLLQSSETNLQSILKTIPDIVFRLDANGNITFISPAISKYLTYPKPLLGHSIFNLVAPEDFGRAQYRVNERRTGKRATSDMELRLLLFDDSSTGEEPTRYFSLSAEGIYIPDKSGRKRYMGTQGIVRDITKRKLLEKQLLQAQKMEVIGNLAAGIAHDLNNILSGLVSYPDLLLMEIPRTDPLYKKIEVIQRSGKKAAAIVQDLLSLARRNVRVDEICNLNMIITDYLESVEFQRIRERHSEVALHTRLQENLPNIKGSPVHLSKVIMNLLINGLEAMPTGGKMAISTTDVYIDTQLDGFEQIPEGEYVRTSVTDEGVGIHPDDLKRIFEPFFTKKSLHLSGTGLGMTVIWATIKDHRGYLDIQSLEGHGTTFSFYLPTTRQSIAGQQERIVLDDYFGSESILIVDDIPEQIDIAEKMLTKLGYRVYGVPSGEQALEFLEKQPVDLVLLDMIMPGGLDGLETYRNMVKIRPNQKAIVTSGFSESERVDKLARLGADSYIQKPYTLEKLAVTIRRELDSEESS